MLRGSLAPGSWTDSCEYGRVKADQLANELGVVDDALWAGVLLPESLPSIATDLLARGADTPSLRLLAGLDLAPFDPRDARDLFLDTLSETSTRARPIPDRVEAAAHLLAVAATTRGLTTQATLHRFYLLAVATDYPEDDEVMRLCGLDDEWIGGWGRTRPEIEAEVRGITTAIASRHQPPPPAVLDAVAGA